MTWFGIQVYAQNLPPVASDDLYTTGFNNQLITDASIGVLSNDTDNGGVGSLWVVSTPVVGPASGTLVLAADGSFVYTPNTGFVGQDQFTYRVCDDGLPSTVVSRFDFNSTPLTQASVGPNATSINPNAAQNGCGIYLASGSGGSAGLDVVVPNTGGIFNFTSFTASFEYRDQESTADIVTAGNFRIYHITGNQLGISISVINGATGLPQTFIQNLGNFLPGSNPYSIFYDERTGSIEYTANGSVSTFALAPPNSPLNTSLASGLTLGRFMDGSGSTTPSLCSMEFTDNSILCDEAVATLNVHATVITNRRITYRVGID
ncbi:hypothetical protein SAMN06265375_1037 [Muriicola jejuensis]|nr:hypothetical protein SAMN06265375_1037 [Muriicola jejuensis]